jgi:hypothetical protein
MKLSDLTAPQIKAAQHGLLVLPIPDSVLRAPSIHSRFTAALASACPHQPGDRIQLPGEPHTPGYDYIALDNSDPQQWWTWRGERDESAEPWERLPTCAFIVERVGAQQASDARVGAALSPGNTWWLIDALAEYAEGDWLYLLMGRLEGSEPCEPQ